MDIHVYVCIHFIRVCVYTYVRACVRACMIHRNDSDVGKN